VKKAGKNHPKTIALARQLGKPQYVAIGLLESLWIFTAEYAPTGLIGRFSVDEIESACYWDGAPGELVSALIERRWIDVRKSPDNCGQSPDNSNCLLIHDWPQHCDDYTKKRLKRDGLDFDPWYQQLADCPELSGKVQTFSASRARGASALPCLASALPVPVPHPEPPPAASPLPDTSPAAFRNGSGKHPKPFNTGNGAAIASALLKVEPDCAEWFRALYLAHPKKKERVLAEQECVALWVTFSDPAKQSAEITRVHELWCQTQAWTEKSGMFCPPLANWLRDEGFTREPPEPLDEVDEYMARRDK